MSLPPREIILEHATLVPHRDGGYAIPGGHVITDKIVAAEYAVALNQHIAALKDKRP